MYPRSNQKKREFVDFSKLDGVQLRHLSEKWEKEAMVFELRMDRFIFNVGANVTPEIKEKKERLWNTANSLWRRLSILEKWRKKAVK